MIQCSYVKSYPVRPNPVITSSKIINVLYFLQIFWIVEIISENVAHDNAKNDGLKGDANRSNKNFWIEEILKEFGANAKLEGGNVRSAGSVKPETVYKDKANRYDQKQKTALSDGAGSAHDFQLSDFMGVFPWWMM